MFTSGGNIGDCNPSNEDNITAGEAVILLFDQIVNVSGLIFRSEGHLLVSERLAAAQLVATETLLINGVEYSFGAAQSATFNNLRSIPFAFGGGASEQFDLLSLSATPVPAALPLLLAGLGGLGVMARRKRKAV